MEITWSNRPLLFVPLDKSRKLDYVFYFCLTDKEEIQRGRVIERGEVAVGTQLVQAIPPGLFWRFHLTVHHPEYVKFNISLTRDALLGIYGRRNIPPTHTQVNTCKHKYRKYNTRSFLKSVAHCFMCYTFIIYLSMY